MSSSGICVVTRVLYVLRESMPVRTAAVTFIGRNSPFRLSHCSMRKRLQDNYSLIRLGRLTFEPEPFSEWYARVRADPHDQPPGPLGFGSILAASNADYAGFADSAVL